MSKLEKEVKILNIDVDYTRDKLIEIGATFINKKEQEIYTYDIPTMYYRFEEALQLLKSTNKLMINTSLAKLKIVLEEFVDLVSDDELKEIYSDLNVSSFDELFKLPSKRIISSFKKSKLFMNLISNNLINPNKWIRLRKSNEKVELTVKHIFEKSSKKIQKVREIEINVSDLDETNKLLESIGIVRRNYQEKVRYSYKYKTAEIEIDLWPMLEAYMEIECDDENIIDEIIKKLEFDSKEIVSLNTEQLYKRKNINILEISDLKF